LLTPPKWSNWWSKLQNSPDFAILVEQLCKNSLFCKEKNWPISTSLANDRQVKINYQVN